MVFYKIDGDVLWNVLEAEARIMSKWYVPHVISDSSLYFVSIQSDAVVEISEPNDLKKTIIHVRRIFSNQPFTLS